MPIKSFIPAILTVPLFAFATLAQSQPDNGRQVQIHPNIIVIAGAHSRAGEQNCGRIIGTKEMFPPENYDAIQEYLRLTGKDKLIVQSPPDNMPVVVPNTSIYSMPTIPPDMSKYPMPIIKPPLNNKQYRHLPNGFFDNQYKP